MNIKKGLPIGVAPRSGKPSYVNNSTTPDQNGQIIEVLPINSNMQTEALRGRLTIIKEDLNNNTNRLYYNQLEVVSDFDQMKNDTSSTPQINEKVDGDMSFSYSNSTTTNQNSQICGILKNIKIKLIMLLKKVILMTVEQMLFLQEI